jgi:hypothetical protein
VAYADTLATIRDNLAAELEDETTRRLALTAAGSPPPTSNSVGGRSVSWYQYVSMMLAQIKAANEQVIEAGGDGGLYEYSVRAYS